LSVGNTEVAAKMAQEVVGGGLFEIKTVKIYPVKHLENIKIKERF